MADEIIYSPSEPYKATMKCYMGMPGREQIVEEGDEISLPPEVGDLYPECLQPLTPRKKKKADPPAA